MNQDTLNFIEGEVSEAYNNSEFEFLDLIGIFHKSVILKLEDLSSLVPEEYIKDLDEINNQLQAFLFLDILFDDLNSTEGMEYLGDKTFSFDNILISISDVVNTGNIIMYPTTNNSVFIAVNVEHFCLDELEDYQEFIRNASELEWVVGEFNVGVYINTQ